MNTTTQTKKSSAEVKVIAINELNKWAKVFYEYEKTHFSQFLGVNIFKVDGSIKQKYDHEKQSYKGRLPDGTFVNVHYWFTSSYNRFDIHVKICVNGGSYDVRPSTAYCQYEETTLTIFKMDDESKLIEANTDISHLSTVYNLADLQSIAGEIKEAAKIYESVADKMPWQFKDVFYIERLTR